jgi:hypothetical protein
VAIGPEVSDALDAMPARDVERLIEKAQRRLARCFACGTDGASPRRSPRRRAETNCCRTLDRRSCSRCPRQPDPDSATYNRSGCRTCLDLGTGPHDRDSKEDEMADRRGKVETRGFDEPDETIEDEKGSAGRISVGGLSVWRVVFEPGWRYTEYAGGDLCMAPHAAYIESGRLHVLTDDGTEVEGGPGAVIVIEPGHDAWTVGDEPCVFIDFGESVRFADGG